jgi:hypothetical protein
MRGAPSEAAAVQGAISSLPCVPAGHISSRAAEAQERGVDPIQVMFDAIEYFMERANETTGEEQDGHILAAVSVAKEAAPFCGRDLSQAHS